MIKISFSKNEIKALMDSSCNVTPLACGENNLTRKNVDDIIDEIEAAELQSYTHCPPPLRKKISKIRRRLLFAFEPEDKRINSRAAT